MINKLFSIYIYRLYSACLVTAIFFYRNQDMAVTATSILLFLGIIFIGVLSLNDVIEGHLVSLSLSRQDNDNFESHFNLSVFDKLLVATTVSTFLILISMLVGVYSDSHDFDPDNTCLGMRDVGC